MLKGSPPDLIDPSVFATKPTSQFPNTVTEKLTIDMEFISIRSGGDPFNLYVH